MLKEASEINWRYQQEAQAQSGFSDEKTKRDGFQQSNSFLKFRAGYLRLPLEDLTSPGKGEW